MLTSLLLFAFLSALPCDESVCVLDINQAVQRELSWDGWAPDVRICIKPRLWVKRQCVIVLQQDWSNTFNVVSIEAYWPNSVRVGRKTRFKAWHRGHPNSPDPTKWYDIDAQVVRWVKP